VRRAGLHVVGAASYAEKASPGGYQDCVDPNGLETGRENEHGCSIAQEIHYEAQPVSENLAEMGGRGSGLTPYTVSVGDEE